MLHCLVGYERRNCPQVELLARAGGERVAECADQPKKRSVGWRRVESIERQQSWLPEVPGSGSFPEQINCGVFITRIAYGTVPGDAWPSQASRPASRSFDPAWIVGGRSHDHLSFASDGEARIQHVSLNEQKARVLIIMANSATEMILTPRWYTVAQVAQLLNYGESKVRMLIITGQLRSIKDGRSRRILPEWVEAYVQDRAKAAEDIW